MNTIEKKKCGRKTLPLSVKKANITFGIRPALKTQIIQHAHRDDVSIAKWLESAINEKIGGDAK
jgi:predicted HicB family RNase H-like nuclease